jgi:HrpA-like RNA helicase
LYYRDKQKKKSNLNNVIIDIQISETIIEQLKRLNYFPNSSDDKFCNKDLQNDNSNLIPQYGHIFDSKFKTKFLKLITGNLHEKLQQTIVATSLLEKDKNIDTNLIVELNNRRSSTKYKDLLKFRSKLPAYKNRLKILDLINANQVVLISGETGKYIF